MKSMTFLRKTWRKKDKDKGTTKGNQDVPLTNEVGMLPEPEPYTPFTSTFDLPASTSPSTVPGHRAQSRSQDVVMFQSAPVLRKVNNRPGSSNSSSRPSLLNDETTTPSSARFPHHYDLGYSRSDGAVWKTSHGPPKNTVHGPPNLNLFSPVSGMSPKSAGGTPPVRPPRPPPLNLDHTTMKRPINTGIPPRSVANRSITFALPPSPRAHSSAGSTTILHSPDNPPVLSEDREGSSTELSETTSRHAPAVIKHIDSHQESPCNLRANLPLSPSSDSFSPAASRKTRRVLDHSDNLLRKQVYQTNLHTSSTPHLPSRNESEVSLLITSDRSANQWDSASNFPLSLFPRPPPSPTIKRKNPKNLMLRVASSGAPLPPLPMPSPLECAPTVTPTVSRPSTPKAYSSLPRSRRMPPPFYDPPSTPLPTPPASPSVLRAPPPPSPPRSLRSVKSTNYLRSELAPPTLASAHRIMSSEPRNLSEDSCNIDGTRLWMSPPSEVQYEIKPFADFQLPISDTQTQWGYAL